MPISVILDTSFLFELVHRPTLLAEVEDLLDSPCIFKTMENCVSELTGIASSDRKEAQAAAAVLEIIKTKKIVVITGHLGTGDDAIKAYCQLNRETACCTQDEALRKQLKKQQIRTITFSHHSKLKFG